MLEVTILFALALIWILFAVISDIKTREIPNWLNFSLVVFALGFRFFYSLFEVGSFDFFYQGVIGFLIFFALGNLFYYTRMFAGGDAKLMMSLGAILPIYNSFIENVWVFGLFILLFLVVGAVYSLTISLYFGLSKFSNLKKEMKKQFKKNKNIFYLFWVFAILLLVIGFFIQGIFIFGIILFLFPYLYLYLKSVDEVCMIKEVGVSKLTLGDWLYKDIKVGKKIIRVTWDGLDEEDLKILRKRKKKVLVRYGIQFAPVFLISFILLWIILEFNLFIDILRVFGF